MCADSTVMSPIEAYTQYLDAYRLDLNSYYPGLNTLFLAVVILELAAGYPDVWSAPVADDTSANAKVTEINRKREQMTQALPLRFVNADAPVPNRKLRTRPYSCCSTKEIWPKRPLLEV